jgi:hypothetical protein
VDTVVDSEDNIEIPVKTTAIAPPNAKPASINELISIIVLTPFPHRLPFGFAGIPLFANAGAQCRNLLWIIELEWEDCVKGRSVHRYDGWPDSGPLTKSIQSNLSIVRI